MHMKKAAAAFLSGLILLTSASLGARAVEAPVVNSVIYQNVDTKTITSGVTQDKIVRYTDQGWQTIYVLKANLNNSNVHIDTLANRDTIQKPQTTSEHMKEWGAIAGINGSFFLASDQAGQQNVIGPMVQGQNLKTADANFNLAKDNMATFGIDNTDVAVFGYWKTDMKVYAPNGGFISIARYNEPFYGYTDFTVLDRKWRTTTIGTRNGYYPDMTEMIIADGVVKEIRYNMEAVDIPVNGYVVITRKENTPLITENFKVGDPVRFEIITAPNADSMKMAVSGGGMIVVDGAIPQTFTHEVAGRHPRTAVGSSRDGKMLYMVAVDGRQSHSTGMTMQELAAFMLEIGSWNAVALDGGGSTTMVSREPGTQTVAVQNSPSDGVQRKIPNAVGVFSKAPPAPLASLRIHTTDPNIFVNTSRAYTVTGYDAYLNPVMINPEEIQWQVTGIEGSFEGNVLRPTSYGTGTITATVAGVKAEYPVYVFGGPVKLTLNHTSITLISKERKTFTVIGEHSEGYKASIDPADINWKTMGGVGFFSGNTFVSTKSGYGYIQASVGDVHVNCGITVLPTVSTLADGFEKTNATFLPYPSAVKGSYSISSEQKHGGEKSGKLSYSFEAAETNRAVYAELSGQGIELPQNAIRVGLWVYNSQENSNWLRIEVKDSKNKVYRLGDLTKLDWKGWRYVEIPLNGVPMPAKLTRIYLVQVNPIAEIGAVYFDDLSVITVEREKMTTETAVKPLVNTVVQNFENINISFSSYPSWVPGGAEIVNDYANSGFSSARLDYAFKETPETQAAYLMLGEKGISIPEGTESIGLWAYSQRFTKSWLRAEVIDAKGEKRYVMFSEGISWTGWKYVEGNIEKIAKPARVTRLYVVNPSPLNEEGHIYLDDLQFNVKTDSKVDFAKLPPDTEPVDYRSKAKTFVQAETNYRFSVFGEAREPANDVEKHLTTFLADKINKYIEVGAFVGNGSHQVLEQLQKPSVSTAAGYNAIDLQGSRFISLDVKAKSIRNGITGQWNWLLQQLDSFTGENVFLFLESDLQTFTDKKEAQLFRDILVKYRNKMKNIWVFYKGAENKVTKDRGVRYFSTAGFDVPELTAENKKAAKYILVTIMDGEVTYEYKPIE
ncbi:MAG: phosphodiester glycosidase family protein [Thermoclostridium sp.]|nr:phosphodiester glycosidase family protein [Thermoclostridium sp.]